MKRLSAILLFIAGSFFCYHAEAQTYELYVGDSQILYCPSAPAGTTMHHVYWTPKGSEISVSSYGLYDAQVTVDKYFTGTIYVTCEYYYTDNGQYQYMHKSVKEYKIGCKAVTLQMNPSYIKIKKGETVQVTYTTSPYGKHPAVTWETDNYRVCEVRNGYVTGVGVGESAIKAKQNMGPAGVCGVTVVAADPDGVTITPSSVELYVRDEKQLTATVTPSDAETELTWNSDNYYIASVSQSGRVTAKDSGTTTITVRTSNGCYAYCTVKVKSVPNSVSLSQSWASIKVNETLQLTATVYPSDAETYLTWLSSDNSVASVSSNGLVRGLSDGEATITVATSNGKEAACVVKVSTVEPSSVKLSKTSASITVEETLQLSATVSPSDAVTELTWESSDDNVATVSNKGLVKGVSSGKCTITVETSNGKKASCEVKVNDIEATAVKLSKTSAAIVVDETLQLTATVTPSNAVTTLTWASGSPKIASVSDNGLVTGIAPGKATITVTTNNGKKASCDVTVTLLPESVSIPESLSIPKGSKKRIDVEIKPKGASTTLTWKSSDSKVATVSSSGEVTAVSVGMARITVKTSNGLSANCMVTVTEPVEPEAVDLNKKKATVSVGYGVTLKCVLTPGDSSTTYTWESEDPEIAKVYSTGYVEGVSEGKTTITVTTANGLTAEAVITVDPVSESIGVEKTSDIIKNLKSLAQKAAAYKQ